VRCVALRSDVNYALVVAVLRVNLVIEKSRKCCNSEKQLKLYVYVGLIYNSLVGRHTSRRPTQTYLPAVQVFQS